MSQLPETLQQHPIPLIELWRYMLCQPTKVTHVFTMLVKAILGLCLVASISLVSYTFLSNDIKYFSCSQCDRSHQTYIHFRNNLQENNSYHDYEVKTNISHILFGIAGSSKTWNNRRLYNEIWWKHNITRGFVWLDEKPADNMPWPETYPPYKVSEDTSKFKYTSSYGSRSAIRIARIVKESFRLGLDNVRWFVMGDDDTVFFTENLVTVLAKYDHNQMYYIGDISESVEQDVIFSYTIGYGGGGFAISYPLAAALVRILDGCIDRYASLYGSDQKIGGCMSEIGVPITQELGFHQMDVRGNPYGLLAAHLLAPLVTLQHSFCYDLRRNWSISVSWGYTLQLYPSLLTAKDLATPLLSFLSWRTWREEPFTFNTRIWSPCPCERPLIYYFNGVNRLDNSGTWTLYKMSPETGKQCEKDYYAPALSIQMFNVSAALLDRDVWKKAPRRQCCEVTNEGETDGVAHVRIRSCSQWESVTPP